MPSSERIAHDTELQTAARHLRPGPGTRAQVVYVMLCSRGQALHPAE